MLYFIPISIQMYDNFHPVMDMLSPKGYAVSFIIINNITTDIVKRKVLEDKKHKVIILNKKDVKPKFKKASYLYYFFKKNVIKEFLENIALNKEQSFIAVGNDSACYIRLLLNTAEKQNIKSILIQDGYLTSRSVNNNFKPQKNHIFKYIYFIQDVLRKLGFDKYFNSYFGNAVNYIGVYGEQSEELFLKSKTSKCEQIKIVGSPRHQKLISLAEENISPYDNSQIKICYISFGHIYLSEKDRKHHLEWEVLNILIKALREVKIEFKLIIRIRPQDKFNNEIETILNSKMCGIKYQISDSSEKINDTILNSDILFAPPSTGLIDSVLLNKPSYQIVNEDYSKIKIFGVPSINSEKEIINILNELHSGNYVYEKDFRKDLFEKTIKNSKEFNAVVKTSEFIMNIADKNV